MDGSSSEEIENVRERKPRQKKKKHDWSMNKIFESNRVIPAGIYLFKVNYRNTRQYVKSVQN